MNLSFAHEISFNYRSQSPLLSHPRGFLFYLTVRASSALNPQTGMTLDLPLLQGTMKNWASGLSADLTPWALFQQAREHFKVWTEQQKADLSEIRLFEERGWGLYSTFAKGDADCFYQHSVFAENLAPPLGALTRVEFCWKLQGADQVDLSLVQEQASGQAVKWLKKKGTLLRESQMLNQLKNQKINLQIDGGALYQICFKSKAPEYSITLTY